MEEKIKIPREENQGIPPKNPRGRPPKYKTAEELQAKIDEYFVSGVSMRKIITGPTNNRKIDLIAVPTITGLVRFLGFCDRRSFYDLEKQKEFSYTIKAARNRIEEIYEMQLQTGNAPGAIFALKNFGWTDTPAIDQTVHYHLTHGYRTKPKDSSLRPEVEGTQ